jgi:AcrR family transcriptional regulator
MGRTPKVVEDRKEQIVDAAIGVFSEKGFARATNRDIAEAAGITAGLIYHYFKSKEELLRAAIERRSAAGLFRSIDKAMFDLEPEEMLRKLLTQMLEVVEQKRFVALMRVYLPEAIHNTTVIPMGLGAIGEATTALKRYLSKNMNDGVLRKTDPAFISHFVLGAIMDLVLRRQVLKDPSVTKYTREQIVDGVVSTVLHGLLAK